jgi:hypothetical protein
MNMLAGSGDYQVRGCLNLFLLNSFQGKSSEEDSEFLCQKLEMCLSDRFRITDTGITAVGKVTANLGEFMKQDL